MSNRPPGGSPLAGTGGLCPRAFATSAPKIARKAATPTTCERYAASATVDRRHVTTRPPIAGTKTWRQEPGMFADEPTHELPPTASDHTEPDSRWRTA